MSRRITFVVLNPPPAVQRALLDGLSPYGFDLVPARGSDHLFEQLERYAPCAVFVPWGEEHRAELEALRRLAAIPAETRPPAILLATNTSRMLIEYGLAAGAAEFSPLPLDPLDLLARLARTTSITGLSLPLQRARLARRPRVVLLESRQVQSEMFRVFLEDQGCDVAVHALVRDGVQALTRERTHLALLAHDFGGIDGLGLLRLLKRQAFLKPIPFFFMAEQLSRAQAQEAVTAGAFDIILQPVNWQQLRAKIARVLGSEPDEPETDATRPITTAQCRVQSARFLDEQGRVDRAKLLKGLGELRALPVVLTRIIQVVNDPNVGAREIGEVVQSDHTLAGKMLRYANSVFYARRHKVATLDQAVVTLGVRAVKGLALGLKALQFIAGQGTSEAFDRQLFWQHCLGVGVVGRLLAEQVRYPEPDEVFVAGLLHDIGKTIFDEYLPDLLADVQVKAQAEGCAFREAEQQVIGFDHAGFGADLADKWNLPHRMRQAFELHHHTPRRLEGRTVEDLALVMLVGAANRLAKALDLGFGGDSHLGPLDPQVVDALRLGALDWSAFARRARDAFRELAEIIFADLGDDFGAYAQTRVTPRLERSAAVVLTSRPESVSLGGVFLAARGWQVHWGHLHEERWAERFLMVRDRRLMLVELDADRELPRLMTQFADYADLLARPCVIACQDPPAGDDPGAEPYRVLTHPYDSVRFTELLRAFQNEQTASADHGAGTAGG